METVLSWLDEDPTMLEQIGFFDRPSLVAFVTKALTTPADVVLAAELDGEMVGYLAAINVMPDRSANVHIGTSPRHRGIGKELMKLGIETAFFQLGLKTLIAMVPNTRRGRAIERFDKRMGFREPDAKILYLTRERWETHNGNGS